MPFTDQNSEPLEIEDNVNMKLVIIKTLQKWDIQQNQNTENAWKDTDFCNLLEDLVINMLKI